jgi:nucleoside-diphosphate-sugar epimerase
LGIIWKLVDSIRYRKIPVTFDDGTQRRDFINVEVTPNRTVLATESGTHGEVYNVVTGKSTSFRTIF